jgi:hypothetical protein
VNIKGTVDVLNKEFEQLKKEVVGRYYYIGWVIWHFMSRLEVM